MTPMDPFPSPGKAPLSATLPERRGFLALRLEEVLTVICRLRVDKPVGSDPEVFRERVKKWMSKAAREAGEAGYAEDTITMAGYAVIAFLDESVLNSPQPMFSEWPRRPLQEEIFGGFLGGEAFFENLEHLLNQPDSEELGDLIEVYLLCLSLGFQGRVGRSLTVLAATPGGGPLVRNGPGHTVDGRFSGSSVRVFRPSLADLFCHPASGQSELLRMSFRPSSRFRVCNRS